MDELRHKLELLEARTPSTPPPPPPTPMVLRAPPPTQMVQPAPPPKPAPPPLMPDPERAPAGASAVLDPAMIAAIEAMGKAMGKEMGRVNSEAIQVLGEQLASKKREKREMRGLAAGKYPVKPKVVDVVGEGEGVDPPEYVMT